MLEHAAACRGVERGPQTAAVEDWSMGADPVDSSRPFPVARTEPASAEQDKDKNMRLSTHSQTNILKCFTRHVSAGRTIIINLWSILNGDPPRNINWLLYNANPIWNFSVWGVTSQVRNKRFSQCWNRRCLGLMTVFINRCDYQITLYYIQARSGSHYTWIDSPLLKIKVLFNFIQLFFLVTLAAFSLSDIWSKYLWIPARHLTGV